LTFRCANDAQRELEGWLLSEDALDLPLDAVEREAVKRGREVLRLMLQAHVHARGTGDVGPAIEVMPAGGSEAASGPTVLGHRRVHRREVVTILGSIDVERTAYGARGAESVHPLDEAARLPARSYSYELQCRVVRGVVKEPFDEAIESVEQATGVSIPKRSAEAIAREAARDFDAFYVQRTAPKPAAETGPILVAAVDCKGIPMVKPEKALRVVRRGKGEKANKKRMATVAAVFTQQPRVRTPEEVVASLFDPPKPRIVGVDEPATPNVRPEHKRVWASVEKSKDDVIADVAAEVERRDPTREKRRVGVTDGERALQKKTAGAVPGIVLILDIIHAIEKLWKAAYCFHPEGSDEAVAWVRERALRLLQGKVSQVVKGMGKSATARGFTGQKRKTVDAVRRYFYRNRRRMCYHEYLRDGLPIASGAVEGACRNLIKDRMERTGMRWTITTAEALVKLRAAYLSGDLEEYWRFHVECDQQRLHPKGRWRVVEE
jgi:hypothetical protein